LENANLWTDTAAPLDGKAQWGGATSAGFPRMPTVPAGGLSGVKTEPGRVIDGPTLLPAAGAEMFLELGGWKDATEMHEAGVTMTSSNLYSDRKSVEGM